MDDMAAKINGLLQDPEAMQQLQALAELFASGQDTAPQTEQPPAQAIQPTEPPAMPPVSPETVQMMAKLMPLLSGIRQETNGTRLLHSLRPLLSEKRRKKLDDATRMMQLMQVLPLLKKGGIL